MNKYVLLMNCVIVALFLFVSCNSEATEDNPEATISISIPETSALVTGSIDLTNPNIAAEALAAIQEKTDQLQLLWHDHREELETVAEAMLQLQREVSADSPDIIWKNPYFNTKNDPPFSVNLSSGADQAEIENLKQKLLSLSSNGSFTTAFPDMSHRFADSDTCEFQLSVIDSRGRHSADVSLVYCAAESPVTVRYWTPDWLDGHWFLCVEWLE